MKNSQQVSEPVDAEFFRLFSAAVELGISLVRDLDFRKIYVSNHLSFHRAYWTEGNSIPSFTPTNLKDHGAAFGSNPNSLINWTEHSAINDLLSYVLSNESIHGYFRSAKYTLAGDNYRLSDEEVKFLFIRLFGGAVDMCMHKLAHDDFSTIWFKPWFRELERGIFDNELEVDLIVPIVGVSFDFDSHWLDEQKIAIFKMNNELQEARFLKQQFDIKVPSIVTGFSSHAFLLKNRRIINDGFLQISHEAQALIQKEISLINSLFGLLKAATGFATGYGQVVLHPIMWAHRYLAHLPVVLSETVRAYPTSFDDGIWRSKPRIVKLNYLDSISEILKTKNTFSNKKMSLALSRLNTCLLRENKEDKILDACIGLEALFSDDGKQEMTHKLALRIAAVSQYFERGGYLKKDVFKAIKKVYSYRSSVVHGGNSNSNDSFVKVANSQIPTEEFAVDILRETIIAIGKHPHFLNPSDIDFDLLLETPDKDG